MAAATTKPGPNALTLLENPWKVTDQPLRMPMAQRYLDQIHSLGKGEVESSILSGSTTKRHEMGLSRDVRIPTSAVSSRTYPEDGNSVRGVSVDSVHGACWALIAWAKGKPADIRDIVADIMPGPTGRTEQRDHASSDRAAARPNRSTVAIMINHGAALESIECCQCEVTQEAA